MSTEQSHQTAIPIQGGPVAPETGAETATPITPDQATAWGKSTLHTAGVTEPTVAAPAAEGDQYSFARLLDPNAPDPEPIVAGPSVRSAQPAKQTSMRPGFWKPATPEQIAKGNKSGYDLAVSNAKYYPNPVAANKK